MTDQQNPPKKWFRKKRYIIPLGTVAFVALISALGGNSRSTEAPIVSPYTETQPAADSQSLTQISQSYKVQSASVKTAEIKPTTGSQSASNKTQSEPVKATDTQPAAAFQSSQPAQTQSATVNTTETNQSTNFDLSNDNYYTNTAGNEVHSPAYTEDSSVPAEASAQCRDGTYSFSQSHSGTCSHHGGVDHWIN